MIITGIGGGIGNQLFQYAVGRRLAYVLGTELKLELSQYDVMKVHYGCELDAFNVQYNVATPEDIAFVKRRQKERGIEFFTHEVTYSHERGRFMPEVLDYPDDIYLNGVWQSEKYFIDIRDVLLRELTLKSFDGKVSRQWLERIRQAECPVSLHVRHGDYVIHWVRLQSSGIMSIEYYMQCVERLKAQLGRFTLFVFSDDLDWARKYLHFDVPVEFVEGCERDIDELYLMSQCRHNIIANSTFSWWGAWLNQNPDKIVLAPDPWIKSKWYNHDIIPDGWTKMPVDFSKVPAIDLPPYYSIVIAVDNDAATLRDCLSSVLSQQFTYYEVVLVDNASSDGSEEIYRQLIDGRKNVRVLRLKRRLGRSTAWNLGIDLARGEYVLILGGADRILANTFSIMHEFIEANYVDIQCSISYAVADGKGEFMISKTRVTKKIDEEFKTLPRTSKIKSTDTSRVGMLATGRINLQLGTKLLRRQFLLENFIRFEDQLEVGAEIIFQLRCLSSAEHIALTPQLYNFVPTPRPRPAATWREDFDRYVEALEPILKAIPDASARKMFEVMLVERYWKDA